MNYTYFEDVPSLKPRFSCDLVAEALSAVLVMPADGATVVGLHAPWGGGKTTLLHAIRRVLESLPTEASSIFIDFNAWKFQQREALWRALILHVLAQISQQGGDKKQIQEMQQSLYRTFAVEEKGPWTVNWRTLILDVIGLALSIVKLDFVADALRNSTGFLGKLFLPGSSKKKEGDSGDTPIDEKRMEKLASVLERETIKRQVLQIESIEQFLEEFRDLITQLTQGPDKTQHRRIYVFIDDLDRCLPEAALEIFESIKLFLDANACRYVVALDRDVIRKGLDVRYSRAGEAAAGQLFINPDEYIEKTISLSYDLPTLVPTDAFQLIDQFSLALLDAQHKKLIVSALGTNPRRVIRFMNTLAVQMRLAQMAAHQNIGSGAWLTAIQKPRDFDLFLKLQLISYRYSGVFSRIIQDDGMLARLQLISNEYQNTVKQNAVEARTNRASKIQNESRLVWPLSEEEDFWMLMSLDPPIPNDKTAVAQATRWFRYQPPEATAAQSR